MQVPDKLSKHAPFIAIFSLALCMAAGFGYSVSSIHSQKSMVDLAGQQAKERASMKRAHNDEKKYLRSQLKERNDLIARQSDQLAELAKKAATTIQETSK